MKTVRVTFGLLCMLALVAMTTIGCEKKEGGEKSEHQLDRTKEFVTVATGPTSGIYFPIGGAFAEALKSAGYNTSSQATGASAENISMISKGRDSAL